MHQIIVINTDLKDQKKLGELMDSVQFYHAKEEGKTYAVNVSFNREDLLECIHHFDQDIAFNIGISNVHPNDVYNKKVGREISASKIKPTMLHLSYVYKSQCDENKLFLEFIDRASRLTYCFRVNSKSEKPHFIKVD